MKKFALFLLLLIFLGTAAWGTDYAWTGAAGDDNWTTSNFNNSGTGNWGAELNYPGYDHFGDFPKDSAIFPINAAVNLNDDPIPSATQLFDCGLFNLVINSGVTVRIITNRDLKVNKLILNGTLILQGTGRLIIRNVTDTEGVTTEYYSGLTVGAGGALTGAALVNFNSEYADVVITAGDVIFSAAANNDLFYGQGRDGVSSGGVLLRSDNINIDASKRIVFRTYGTGINYFTDISTPHNNNILSEAGGFTDFRVNYLSTGSLTVNGSARFYNDLSISANGITFGTIIGYGKSAEIIGGAGGVTLNGGSNIAALQVTGNTININGDITSSGTQTYTGAVTLGGALGETRALQGATVTLGTITGANHPLTITGNGTFSSGGSGIGALSVTGNAEFQNAALSALSVSVGGNSSIGNVINTTAAAGQTYNGQVTLTGGVQLNAGAANPVSLGNASARIIGGNNSLTITGIATLNGTGSRLGALYINQDVTFQNARFEAASVYVAGKSEISADIDTTGTQNYTGIVTINGLRTLTSTGDGITTGTGNVSSAGGVNITASGITIGSGGINSNTTAAGVITLTSNSSAVVNINGNIYGQELVINASSGTIYINADITTGGSQTYNGSQITLGGTGTRELRSAAGSVRAAGVVGGTAGVTVYASAGIEMNAANTLTSATAGTSITLNNNQGTPSGNIVFRSAAAGAVTLNAINNTAANNAANGNITISESGEIILGSITASNTASFGSAGTAGRITQTGVIQAANLEINSSGEINLANANSVGILTVSGAGGEVTFRNSAALTLGAINTGAHNVTITTAAGAISQTTSPAPAAVTTTGTLTLTAGGGITLENANNVRTLTVS